MHCTTRWASFHSAYHVVHGASKTSYRPEPNNNRSLHTGGVIGPRERTQRIEVQIRTRDMHEVAELGRSGALETKQQAAGRWAGNIVAARLGAPRTERRPRNSRDQTGEVKDQ